MDSSKHKDGERLEARVAELEARFALQEQSVLELSDELYRQQRQIAVLLDRLEHVAGRLEALAAQSPSTDRGQEVPPHY